MLLFSPTGNNTALNVQHILIKQVNVAVWPFKFVRRSKTSVALFLLITEDIPRCLFDPPVYIYIRLDVSGRGCRHKGIDLAV